MHYWFDPGFERCSLMLKKIMDKDMNMRNFRDHWLNLEDSGQRAMWVVGFGLDWESDCDETKAFGKMVFMKSFWEKKPKVNNNNNNSNNKSNMGLHSLAHLWVHPFICPLIFQGFIQGLLYTETIVILRDGWNTVQAVKLRTLLLWQG